MAALHENIKCIGIQLDKGSEHILIVSIRSWLASLVKIKCTLAVHFNIYTKKNV